MKDMFVQLKLRHVTTGGIMVAWIKDDPKIKVGKHITLRNCEFAENDECWEVLDKFNSILKDKIHTDWNNNI